MKTWTLLQFLIGCNCKGKTDRAVFIKIKPNFYYEKYWSITNVWKLITCVGSGIKLPLYEHRADNSTG